MDRKKTMRDGVPEADELERVLEPIERRMYLDLYAALPQAVAHRCGIDWSEEGKVLRLLCGQADHPFLNRVMGVPGGGEDREEWIDAIAATYRDRGVSRWMIQVAPADLSPEWEEAFAARGLVPLRGWAKHVGRVERLTPPPAAEACDLRIESIDRRSSASWASILVPAFSFPDGADAWLAATIGRPGWIHYLAFDGEEPAATAALYVADGVGTLTFAATRPSHRRRGAQSALIARRILDARRLGLEWLVTETDEELPERPNPSYHNVERAGLPARYVRANWGPPPPGSGS